MGSIADAVPLAPEDRAILALEGPTVAGHTCKVVVLGPGAPGAAALRDAVASRLAGAPLLTRRLGGSQDAPAWVPDPGFDLAAHVVDAPVDAPLDGPGLRALVAGLFAERLDRARPLWRIDVAPLDGGGRALVWRIHHALADGTAAMRYASTLLWDPDDASGDPAARRAPQAAATVHDHTHPDDTRRRRHLAATLRRELARSHERSPFDGRIGARRSVAFATVPLAPLHDAARRAAQATVNDAVLAVVAGALRRWLQARHGPLGDVRVRVPVSLHHEGDDSANRDSFFDVALPLGAGDPVERLRAVRAATAECKEEHDAETMDALLRELAAVAPALERFAERVEASPRRFAVSVSNVPGPRGPVHVLRAPVRSLHALAEIGRRHALRIAVVSATGTLGFGLCADPDLVDGLDDLAAGIEAEAALLAAAG
ncbi:MAG TPA: wax ester/triacylglycerol synthase domain-containing protein [Capillimicrobium sp.]|nr:wax ester/triacylglycerol synthase domain-containing protein [Capillimicrobium sp.]